MTIEKLPVRFSGRGDMKGYEFEQVKRGNDKAIYKVVDLHGREVFEVIKISKSAKCVDFDNKIFSDTEFKERYPKTKDFGSYGWNFLSIEKAENKFNNL